MPWLYFALSAVSFAIAFRTQSLGVAAIFLLVALGLLIAGAVGLAAARIQTRSQSPAGLLGPEQAALIQRRRNEAPVPAPPETAATGSAEGAAPQADAGDRPSER